MKLDLFFDASPAIQLHTIAAIGAFVIGGAVLWRRKGGTAHRTAGYAFVLLMLITAFSAFFIHEIRVWGTWSPIHLLAVASPISIYFAIMAARQGNIMQHKKLLQRTYLGAMVIAGGFAFLPGRLMNEVLFGEGAFAAFHAISAVVLSLLLVGGAFIVIRQMRSNFTR